MEVKTGYKQTEVGVIPKDWNFGELGSLNPTVTSGSRGWAHYYSDMGSAFIRITNLSRQTIYIDLADLRLVNLPKNDTEGLRTQLHDGDVLISITADIGIVGYVDSTVPKPAYINQHIALVRFDTEKIDSRFLSYYLASESPQRAFRAGTDQGAKAGMNLTGVRNIRAAFPPLPEQRAIATALSDVDALLSKLDQLITKKRDLKQATMQQLLTGQTRLPGFSGEWDVKRLGDVAVMGSGGTPISSVPYFYGGEFPWVSISDMTKGGKVIVSTDRNLSAAGLANSAAQMFPAGTVLYAMYASLGECSKYS
jgi:type I restriction enzyme S subunit